VEGVEWRLVAAKGDELARTRLTTGGLSVKEVPPI
jgi:hypothetical protein